MTSFREQHQINGNNIRPLVSIVMNFTKPTASQPALLTFDEVTTFLHEFGHSLHGMLSQCTYNSTSGTNVYRDFVELPFTDHGKLGFRKRMAGYLGNPLSNRRKNTPGLHDQDSKSSKFPKCISKRPANKFRHCGYGLAFYNRLISGVCCSFRTTSHGFH